MKKVAATPEHLAAAFRKARRQIGADVSCTWSGSYAGDVVYKDGRQAMVFVKVIRFCPKALEMRPESGGLLVKL